MNIWFGVNLIVLVNLLFFIRTISYDYVSDDLPVSKRDKPFPKNILHRLWIQFIGGRYVFSKEAHTLTLLIHILNCILIFLAFGRNAVSLTTSLLFSINPILTQGGSIWVSGKPYSTAASCILFAYCIPYIAPVVYILAAYFSGCALLSMLPFLLTKFWFWSLLPLLCFGIFYKVILKKWDLKKATNKEMTLIAWRKFIPYFKTFGYYFRICTMPYKLGLYHTFLWGIGVNEKYNKKGYKLTKDFWIGVIIFILSGLHIIFIHDKVSFGLFWFMVNISMWCNFITISQQIAERYLYLPTVGLMIALSNFIWLLPYPFNYILFSISFVYYATRLWHYREAYVNDYWQVEYNTMEQKESHYAWIARGLKKYHIGDWDGALRDFGEARIQNPDDFKQNFNMAVMFMVLGNIVECEKHLKYAEENVYSGCEESQMKEFIEPTKRLLEIIKKEGKIDVKELRIIQ